MMKPLRDRVLRDKKFPAPYFKKSIQNHSLPRVSLRFRVLHFGDGFSSAIPVHYGQKLNHFGVRAIAGEYDE
jgi:hypothetical protein